MRDRCVWLPCIFVGSLYSRAARGEAGGRVDAAGVRESRPMRRRTPSIIAGVHMVRGTSRAIASCSERQGEAGGRRPQTPQEFVRAGRARRCVQGWHAYLRAAF